MFRLVLFFPLYLGFVDIGCFDESRSSSITLVSVWKQMLIKFSIAKKSCLIIVEFKT